MRAGVGEAGEGLGSRDDPSSGDCDDVGAAAEHPALCGRCVSNMFGAGETRHFA